MGVMRHRAGVPAPPSPVVPAVRQHPPPAVASRLQPSDPGILRGSGVTATGHRRDANEDAFLAGPAWFVVADGMGGHAAGEVASRIVIDAFAAAPEPASVDDVRAVVVRAHTAIRRYAAHHRLTGMGTTVVGVTAVEHGHRPALAVVHVGDSRCYRMIDGELELVTTDHSHVQELLDAGRLRPAHAATHPLRNVVTRALGVDAGVDPDVAILPAAPARLLLCSDGLSNELAPALIGRVLAAAHGPRSAAQHLVELALAGPARDNVTALVVDVAEGAR
jgi:protein phosphatase